MVLLIIPKFIWQHHKYGFTKQHGRHQCIIDISLCNSNNIFHQRIKNQRIINWKYSSNDYRIQQQNIHQIYFYSDHCITILHFTTHYKKGINYIRTLRIVRYHSTRWIWRHLVCVKWRIYSILNQNCTKFNTIASTHARTISFINNINL